MSYPELTIEDAKRYIEDGCRTETIRTWTVTVLPETAEQYLLPEVNTDNFRSPDQRRISSYLQQRKDKLWVDGVADVSVDINGVLVNGQHVLMMCAKGYPVVVRFTTGMPAESSDVYDTGKVRTARSVMEHHEIPYDVSATLRQWLPLSQGVRGSSVPPIEPGRIMGIWNSNSWFQENVEEALEVAKKLHEVTRVSKSISAAIYLFIKKHDPSGVREFFDGLTSVISTDAHDPRHFTMRALQSSPLLRLEGRKRAPGASQEHKEKLFILKAYLHWKAGGTAPYSFDDTRKPAGMAFSDGSALERGMRIPDLS